jgi:hypothetical protein
VDELTALGELTGAELELAGVELAGVELEDDDDEGELLQPATSPAITASTDPAVTICLSFMVWLPFRIEGELHARSRSYVAPWAGTDSTAGSATADGRSALSSSTRTAASAGKRTDA